MSVLCVFLVYMILLLVSSALNPFYSSSVFIHNETVHYLAGNLYFHAAGYVCDTDYWSPETVYRMILFGRDNSVYILYGGKHYGKNKSRKIS